MSNVRFYRLSTLPEFEGVKHQGIFVHLTQAGKNGSPKAGLWFGGAAGWEYLTNDTSPESITNAINALDVTGYAQATITTAADSSTLTIKGIKEEDGKINEDTNLKFDVAIDGVYNSTDNKIATQTTVTNAIEALDSEGTIQAVTTAPAQDNTANTVLTFNGIKEENGIISQGVTTENAETFIVGDAKLNIQIGSNENEAFEVFSANAKENKSIYLDGNVFKKNVDGDKNVLSIYTTKGVSSTNPLVTQKDIDSLAGAMHYKGAITAGDEFTPDNWPTKVAAGDVYIATNKFQKDEITIESGDLIVFNSASLTDYKIVQSNITLGTGAGQVAANTEGLTNGNLVVATDKGIKTIGISASVLKETNNTRNLTYGNVTGGITITDSLKIMNRDFNESINIVSENDSIQITVEKDVQADKGVKLDLVWNTTIE